MFPIFRVAPVSRLTPAACRFGALMAIAVLAASSAGFGAAGVVESAGFTLQAECASVPEVVTVTNSGSAPAALAGWRLVSDPADLEVFQLTAVGSLSPGETVYIESGPHASGAFVWSADQVFRDGDSSDYVQLVDGAGQVVAQTDCEGTSPTATVDGVPDGGGPPGSGQRIPPYLLAAVGGWLAAGGLAVVLAAFVLGDFARRERAPVVIQAAGLAGGAGSLSEISPRAAADLRPYLVAASLAAGSLAALVALAARRKKRR